MKTAFSVFASTFVATILVSACASTNFQAYEGRSGSQIVEGQGGTKETIDGVDVWRSGTPPRKYQVLGETVVEDFDNMFGNSRIRSALVKEVRKAGGNAAVLAESSGGGQTMGVAITPTGGVIPAAGFGKKAVRYVIVKYL